MVVGAHGVSGRIVRERTVGSERLVIVLSATCEADVDRRPAVGASRSTRKTARRDRLVRLTDEHMTVVTASDRYRLLLHARV